MKNRILALLAIIPLLLIAVGGTAFAAGGSQSSVGEYTFGINSATSTLTDLSYLSVNGNLLLASEVTANSSGIGGILPPTVNGVTTLDNATVLSGTQGNIFLMMSNHRESSISYSLSAIPQQVNLNFSGELRAMMNPLGLSFNLLSTVQSYVYLMIVNESQFYLFSNAPLTGTGSNVTFYSNGYVLTGIISFASLVKEIKNLQGLQDSKFTYNNTTGQVIGERLTFNFNASTGVFSDFTNNHLNSEIFTQAYASGNGSLLEGSALPQIPVDQAIVIGSLFVYANNTAIFAVHDNPALYGAVILDNGTLHLTLAQGMTAKMVTTLGKNYTIQRAVVAANSSTVINDTLNLNGSVIAGPHAILISGNNQSIYAFLVNANATINGSNVNITTTGIAKISFVAPPGLQGLDSAIAHTIQRYIQNGDIAAAISITGTSSANVSVSIMFNSTVQATVSTVSLGSASVELSAAAGHHAGTNVVIYIANSVISNQSTVHVTFDGYSVSLQSLSLVVNDTSSVNASFSLVKIPGGLLVVLHVPHFSSHTVDVYSTTSPTGSNPLGAFQNGSGLLVLVAIIAVIVVISATALRMRSKK